MADRVSARITIGGAVSCDQYQALCALIQNEALCVEWDGDLFTPNTRVAGEPLHLCAHEVSWGSFNALEQYCCTNGIAYHRWSGACRGGGAKGSGDAKHRWKGPGGSFGAERIVFDGKQGPFNYDADEDDRIVLPAETIENLGSMRAIRAYLKPAAFVVPPLAIT